MPESEKNEEEKKSASISSTITTTNKSIRETEKKFEFGDYDRGNLIPMQNKRLKKSSFRLEKKSLIQFQAKKLY